MHAFCRQQRTELDSRPPDSVVRARNRTFSRRVESGSDITRRKAFRFRIEQSGRTKRCEVYSRRVESSPLGVPTPERRRPHGSFP
ncbi:MAG: hypothetical protein JWQ49_4817 [Edaphobacter sp.]|nr:hypothetical protein [Edaphobacter sp.]